MTLLVFILVALILPLCARVRLRIQAGEAFCLSANWLIFGFSTKADGKKTSSKKVIAEKKAGTAKKKKKKPKEKKSAKPGAKLGITLDGILDLLDKCWPPVRRMFRSIELSGVRLHIEVGGSDAAEVAIKCGKIYGFVSYGTTVLMSLFRTVRIDSIKIEPNFLSDDTRQDVDITVAIRPIRVICTAVIVVIKAAPAVFRMTRPGTAKTDEQAHSAA